MLGAAWDEMYFENGEATNYKKASPIEMPALFVEFESNSDATRVRGRDDVPRHQVIIC